MGVQIFPALTGYDKNYFWHPSRRSGDWKSIPHQLDELDAISKQLGILSLNDFISTSREESPFDDETMDDFEREGELIDGVWYCQGQALWSVEPQWFEPEQGLITVETLLEHLESLQNQESIDRDWDEDFAGVRHELENIRAILNRAIQENRLFRLAISI